MQSFQTSTDLLAHFDHPKTINSPDAKWVTGLERNDPPANFDNWPVVAKRGIRWVFTWAAALAVVTFAGCVLAEFFCRMSAERKLTLAARAGVHEATLPRATYDSVTAAVERRLENHPQLARHLRLTLIHNGSPAPGQFRGADGDRYAIILTIPGNAAMPAWLQTLISWRGDSLIHAHAENRAPGRKLAFGTGLATSPIR
jgi:hypothetical protein